MKKICLFFVFLTLFCTMTGFAGGGQQGSQGNSITLTVWDEYADNEMRDAIEQITKLFMEKNPGIKVERVAKTTTVMLNTLRPAFMGGDAPDIIETEVGIGYIGPFIRANYIMDLTEAWKTYGWDSKLAAASKQIPTVGNMTYGVGHELEAMSCYYNKTKFAELGLKIPTTAAEMTDMLQKIKDAGYLPLTNYMTEEWSSNMNTVGTFMYGFMSKEEIESCMNNDGPWNLPSVKNAISCLEDWLAKGFFPRNPEVGGDNAADAFYQEQALVVITGNWSIGGIERVVGNKFETGIFSFPSGTAGRKASQVNFCGSGYMINNQSKNREAALKYVDFVLASPETAKIWYEVGKVIPPYTGNISGLKVSPLTQLVQQSLNDSAINNTAGINMWLPPSAFEFFSHAGQRIIMKRLNHDSFINELQQAYDTDRTAKATRATFN
ncbi:MAG: extracellular solute-binding protein [Treponema sp.]|jgi:raffinose/stachyose/melibiose transport system substrate-binding protein|nr:extracellular solute-binding protein [Treponema sp.]